MIFKIKKFSLIFFLEFNEFIINFYEYFRSLISIKSYFHIFNKDIKNLIKFNNSNLDFKSKKDNFILIDIFFDYSWIISNSIISTDYAKKYDLQLFSYNSQPGGYRRNPLLNSLFNSFGCKQHLTVKLNLAEKIYRIRLFFKLIKNLKTKNDLFKLIIDDVWIGVDIYESILRGYTPTVQIENLNTKIQIFKALKYFIYFKKFFDNKKIKALFLSHDTYIPTGIPMKLAFKYKIPVYFANSREIIQVEKPHHLYFRFHKYSYYYDSLVNELKKNALDVSKEKLSKRLDGVLKIDIDYQEKSAFEKKIIPKQIKNTSKTKILITTHCFFDNPHCYGGLLFIDFFEWLSFLAEKSFVTDYEWYIKPHRDYLPGTFEVLNSFIPKFSNLKIVDPNTSFHQLKREGIINILTCYGSVGHELPLLGFNVINAGYNPHISFDFNIHCLNINDYSKVIENLSDIKKEVNFTDIYKFYYIHYIHLRCDFFAKNLKKNTDSILNFTGKEFVKTFLSNDKYYSEFKNNLSNFNNFNSIYSWEYLYKDNKYFKPELRNNKILN